MITAAMLLQALTNVPADWSFRDIITVSGAIGNISALVGVGAVALHRIRMLEISFNSFKESIDGQALARERRVTEIEQSTKTAHHRIDASSSSPDIKDILPMIHSLVEGQNRRDDKIDRLLAELVGRAR